LRERRNHDSSLGRREINVKSIIVTALVGDTADERETLWRDGQGLCLFAKWLEKDHFVWPSPADSS
jgi:transposase